MRAFAQDTYGTPDVLTLRETTPPTPADDEVLVRVHAAAICPSDWHYLTGQPYAIRVFGASMGFGPRRPKHPVRGVDLAGRVEAAGRAVTRFQPGDAVFGQGRGAFADYACAAERALAPAPAGCTFVQAAAVPESASTALQGLRDAAGLGPGQHLLINGASGGVGTCAVQLAHHWGATVTAVCSGRNADLVRSLGADHVVDYTREDVTRGDIRYDVVFDLIGNHSVRAYRRVLAPDGTLVLAGGGGGAGHGRWLGPLGLIARAGVVSPFVSQTLMFLMAQNPDAAQLAELAAYIEAGTLTPVVDRTYPLADGQDAVRYLAAGHARGKVVLVTDAEHD